MSRSNLIRRRPHPTKLRSTPTTCDTCNAFASGFNDVQLRANEAHTHCRECARVVAPRYAVIEECEHGIRLLGLDSAQLCWRCEAWLAVEEEGSVSL